MNCSSRITIDEFEKKLYTSFQNCQAGDKCAVELTFEGKKIRICHIITNNVELFFHFTFISHIVIENTITPIIMSTPRIVSSKQKSAIAFSRRAHFGSMCCVKIENVN